MHIDNAFVVINRLLINICLCICNCKFLINLLSKPCCLTFSNKIYLLCKNLKRIFQKHCVTSVTIQVSLHINTFLVFQVTEIFGFYLVNFVSQDYLITPSYRTSLRSLKKPLR